MNIAVISGIIFTYCFLINGCMSISSRKSVALVTGANKGIGFEIARKLTAVQDLTTILACRNVELGHEAADKLRRSGCSDVVVHRLDITDVGSAKQLKENIAQEYGKLDILINNAAICFNDPTLYGKCEHTPFEDQVGPTLNTNFFGTLSLIEAMLPLLHQSSSPRIVNIASAAGRLSILKSKEKISMFTSDTLQIEQLSDLMRQFMLDVKLGRHIEQGWPNTCYGMSKLGLIALTKILARNEPHIFVNSVDPGYCATDQNANRGHLPAEFGAQTPVWLALLPESDCVTGYHFYDRKAIAW